MRMGEPAFSSMNILKLQKIGKILAKNCFYSYGMTAGQTTAILAPPLPYRPPCHLLPRPVSTTHLLTVLTQPEREGRREVNNPHMTAVSVPVTFDMSS